jgi:hypothetical protein
MNETVSQVTGKKWCPIAAQICASFQDDWNVGAATEGKLKPIGSNSKIIIGDLDLGAPQGCRPTAERAVPAGGAQQIIRHSRIAFKNRSVIHNWGVSFEINLMQISARLKGLAADVDNFAWDCYTREAETNGESLIADSGAIVGYCYTLQAGILERSRGNVGDAIWDYITSG